MRAERPHRGRARVFHARSVRGAARAQLLKRPHPARAEHLPGAFGHHGKHPADAAFRLRDRAVGEGEVDLLVKTVPLQDQPQVLVVGRLAAVQHPGEHAADHRPGVRPDLRARQAERGMLGPEDRHEGVVVHHRQLRAPHDQDRERGVQADTHRRPQLHRPARERPERGRRPVGLHHQPGERTAVLRHQQFGRKADTTSTAPAATTAPRPPNGHEPHLLHHREPGQPDALRAAPQLPTPSQLRF